MKNVTVTLPDDVYHRVRVRAAREGKSVSAVAQRYVRAFIGEETPEDLADPSRAEVLMAIQEFEEAARARAAKRSLRSKEKS